jgi:hypothetical protein
MRRMSMRDGVFINGLGPLACKIALHLHNSDSSIVRMETIIEFARQMRLKSHLPYALQQLEELEVAHVCRHCDCLVGIACDPNTAQWCQRHRNTGGVRTRHLPDCPAARKPAQPARPHDLKFYQRAARVRRAA